MRFADGELDADEMAVIEKAMETNDDLVARVAMFIETKAEAQAALKPLLDEPVPEKLKATVEAMIEAKRAEETNAPRTKPALPSCRSRRARRLRSRLCASGRYRSPPRSRPLSAAWRATGAANTGERGQGGLWVAGIIQAGARRSARNDRVRQGNQARRDQRPVPGQSPPSATMRRSCAANSRSICKTTPR